MLGKNSGWMWWHALGRRKTLDSLAVGNSQLARVLSTFDLTALGVGSTLGVGVYVLAGNVSKNIAGPAVVLSFLIAATASVFAGLCYAEFGARVPRAGSAYIYSYVCVGEFLAFIIGWNLILEYVIGSASVARGLSKYLDSLLNETMERTFLEIMPVSASSLAPYFDMFAFGISVILAVALALGVKESSLVNNLFTIVNIGVVMFVILAGSFKADPNNWNIKKENIHIDNPEAAGEGGFFPFGVSGAIKGAATCFYGFVGFDCVATTGEEVRNPQKAIPIAIIASLSIIFLSYFGVSTVLTLMWPYYLQDPDAPIPKVFIAIGWPVAQWIVTIGGIFGLCASLFGAMFPLPRIIYAMSMDGLIFRFLGQVHHYFKTPVYGTLIAGLLTGLMAAFFDLDQLVNMMSIGTLLAYTIVAASVLLLRYKADVHEETEGYALLPSDVKDNEREETIYKDLDPYGESDIISSEYIESTNLVTLKESMSCGTVLKQLFNPFRLRHPTFLSSRIVAVEVLAFGVLSTLLSLCVIFWERHLVDMNPWALSVTLVIGGFLVLILLSVSMQPVSSEHLTFKVPFVPVIPAASILINIYLMLKLDGDTWIRFGVWMVIGFAIYFLYGVKKSKATYLNNSVRELQPASSQLTEDLQSVEMGKGKNQLSGSQTSTNMADHKHPQQNIITEIDSPMISSGMNSSMLLQCDSVLKQNLDSKMDNDYLQKSLAYIDDLERILDYNDALDYNRKTTALSDSTDYVIEYENKNSSLIHNAPLPSTGESFVLREATLSIVDHSSASVVSYPANVSLSSEYIQTASINHVRRSPSGRSARNLYPNVIVVSYDQDKKQDKVGYDEYRDGTEIGTISTESHQTLFYKGSVYENQEYLADHKQNTSTEDSKLNSELTIQSPFPPPPPPPPPPLPPPPFPSSPVTASSSSNILCKRVSLEGDLSNSAIRSSSESGYDTAGNDDFVHAKSKTEPTTPVTPDPKFLLRMGSLKASDFARKLEAMLQEKLHDVKYDPKHKKPQLFTKNSTNTKSSANTEKLKHLTVITVDSYTQQDGRAKNQNDSVAKSKVTQNPADEQLINREMELANIKGKLEQFFANRGEALVQPRPSSHTNLISLATERCDDEQFKLKQLSKKPIFNETEKLKISNEKNSFDTIRKQRLLMGEVLASLKFVASKNASVNRADSEVDSLSDASEEGEVFEG